jgi:hypothetical protein
MVGIHDRTIRLTLTQKPEIFAAVGKLISLLFVYTLIYQTYPV